MGIFSAGNSHNSLIDALPPLEDIANLRSGRNPREGYQRGAGLRYFGLGEKIQAEPDFREAEALALGRTIVALPRLMNLYLLIRFFLPRIGPGHIIEFGSYRGGSALFMAKLAQRHLPGVQVYALDTFQGMPETDKTVDAHNAKDFDGPDLVEMEAVRVRNRLDNLHLIRGLFQETAPELLAKAKTIALAHIDCDIYSAVAFAWDAVKPHMTPGGYVVFDDATECTCLGATEAVERLAVARDGLFSEQIDPHFVFRYPPLS